MTDNERLVVFNIKEVEGLYDITTNDCRARGYGCIGVPFSKALVTIQEMSKWLHSWDGLNVVFAFEVEKQ